jgi:type I restriction enzyme M protein
MLDRITEQMEEDIKLEVKARFDYEIPVIEVGKESTGTMSVPIESELESVAKEFKKYRISNKLWEDRSVRVEYEIFDDRFQRVVAAGEPEVFYGKNGDNH